MRTTLSLLLTMSGCTGLWGGGSDPDDDRLQGNQGEEDDTAQDDQGENEDSADTQDTGPFGAMAPWLTTLAFPSPCGIYEYEVIDPANETLSPTPLPWMEMELDARGFPSTQTYTRQDVSLYYNIYAPFSWTWTYDVDLEGRLTSVSILQPSDGAVPHREWSIEYTYADTAGIPSEAVVEDGDTGWFDEQIWTYDGSAPTEWSLSITHIGDGPYVDIEDVTFEATFDATGQITSHTIDRPSWNNSDVQTFVWQAPEGLVEIEDKHFEGSSSGTWNDYTDIEHDGDTIKVYVHDNPQSSRYLAQEVELSNGVVDAYTVSTAPGPYGSQSTTRFLPVADVEGQAGYRAQSGNAGWLYRGPQPTFGIPDHGRTDALPAFEEPWTIRLLTIANYVRFAEPLELPEPGYNTIWNRPDIIHDADAQFRAWQWKDGNGNWVSSDRVRYDDAGNITQYWNYDASGTLSKVYHMDYECYADLVTGTMPTRSEDIAVPAP